MDKKFITLWIAVLFSFSVRAQLDGICSEADLFGQSLDGSIFEYQIYSPVLRLTQRYTDFAQVKNTTPEELMISQMSVQNNEWLAYNFENEVSWRPEQFDRITTQDPDLNFIEIVRKISYAHNGAEYAIMRLRLYDDRRERPATLTLMATKKQGRWVLLRNADKSAMEFLMMGLNIEYLDAVFENLEVDNGEMNNIIGPSWKGDVFSPSYVHRKLGNLMLKNETDLNDVFERSNPSVSEKSDFQEYTSGLKTEKSEIKTDYIVPLTGQEFCSYFTNQLSEFDNASINRIVDYLKKQNPSTDGSEPNILPVHKFEYQKDNKQLVFIKYSIEIEENVRENKLDILALTGNTYGAYADVTPADELLKNILTRAKPDLIIQFSNGEDDTDYPVINSLKSDIQDANGVLDIEKTARTIADNATRLAEYLD